MVFPQTILSDLKKNKSFKRVIVRKESGSGNDFVHNVTNGTCTEKRYALLPEEEKEAATV